MTTHATGHFTVKSWDEQPYGEIADAPKLTRASIVETLSGDIEGECRNETLMVYADDGSATFISQDRVVGRLGDRTGSFVLHTTGAYTDGVATGEWTVVPGSGAGELRGLRGTGGYTATKEPPADFHLDYTLE